MILATLQLRCICILRVSELRIITIVIKEGYAAMAGSDIFVWRLDVPSNVTKLYIYDIHFMYKRDIICGKRFSFMKALR